MFWILSKIKLPLVIDRTDARVMFTEIQHTQSLESGQIRREKLLIQILEFYNEIGCYASLCRSKHS